jgi:hypothetical protein
VSVVYPTYETGGKSECSSSALLLHLPGFPRDPDIEQELTIHTKIEEDIFYPAFREAAEKQDDRKLYYEALEEHHVVDTVLPEIKKSNPASDEFAAKAKVLKDLVEHHAEEEESEMFPRARKLMEREELIELGARLMEEKESLAQGGRRAMAGSR